MEDTEIFTDCPICKDSLLTPRIYPCGHHICEECMIKSDQNTHSESPAALPIYKCPICRHETMEEWWKRPIDTNLIDLLCKLSEDYKEKHESHSKHESEQLEITIPTNINLAHMCKNMREYKIIEMNASESRTKKTILNV